MFAWRSTTFFSVPHDSFSVLHYIDDTKRALFNFSLTWCSMQYNHNLTDISNELGNKLVKQVLWGITLIGCSAFIIAMAQVIDIILIIEIATTSCAVMVSTLCLMHIYQEHRIWQRYERHLMKKVLKKIQQHYTQLPTLHFIKNCLLQVLETTPCKELRLQTLQHYHAEQCSLEAFVRFCRQQQADIAALTDLGLCWD